MLTILQRWRATSLTVLCEGTSFTRASTQRAVPYNNPCRYLRMHIPWLLERLQRNHFCFSRRSWCELCDTASDQLPEGEEDAACAGFRASWGRRMDC